MEAPKTPSPKTKVEKVITAGKGGERPPRGLRTILWDTLGPNTEKILAGAAIVAVLGGAAYYLRGS